MTSAPALLQIVRFLVDRPGIGHQQRAAIAIVLVLGKPHHGEGARHGDLDRPTGDGAQMLDVAHLDRLGAADLANDARDDLAGLVAAFDFGRIVDVDSVERRREAVEVAFAPDLAVRNDVEAGRLLRAHRLFGGVVLRFLEKRLGHAPDRLEPDARRLTRQHDLPVHQPVRLRQAADNRGRHQDIHASFATRVFRLRMILSENRFTLFGNMRSLTPPPPPSILSPRSPQSRTPHPCPRCHRKSRPRRAPNRPHP